MAPKASVGLPFGQFPEKPDVIWGGTYVEAHGQEVPAAYRENARSDKDLGADMQGTKRRFGRSLVASSLSLSMMCLAVGLSAGTAHAIDADTGWTHEDQSYLDPAGSGYSGVDCANNTVYGCVGWSNTPFFTLPIINVNIGLTGNFRTYFMDAINNFANGSTGANGMRTPHGPYYNTGNPAVGSGILYLGAEPLGPYCGITQADLNPADRLNGGLNGTQTTRIEGAVIKLNSTKTYYFGGMVPPSGCNLRATYSHELGHTAGLGHTAFTGQVMSFNNAVDHNAGGGDVRAQRCIYEYDAIKAANPSVDPCHP